MQQYQYKYKYRLVCEPRTLPAQEKVSNSGEVYNFLRQRYDELDTFVENFSILGLNQANQPVLFKVVSTGGITAAVVDIRVIAKYLLDSLCVSFIVCHNHPSGSIKPSDADRKQTQKIKDALQLFDIRLLDHLILGDIGYYSFADTDGI